jgi:hypothetical protein
LGGVLHGHPNDSRTRTYSVAHLGQGIILAKALIDAGVEERMKTLAGAGHEDMQSRNAASQELVEAFLSLHLK